MGVVQLAETLAFLHNDATLVHCGISPQVVTMWDRCRSGTAEALASHVYSDVMLLHCVLLPWTRSTIQSVLSNLPWSCSTNRLH
eukprot:1141134-Pelagomonas_calceolata.AAC.4